MLYATTPDECVKSTSDIFYSVYSYAKLQCAARGQMDILNECGGHAARCHKLYL